nr:hypothetical protein [uncultured Oscillibacter sp.]
MEGIQGLRRQTLAPVQRAVPAEAKRAAAPARTDSFQSVLTEAERAEQAARTPELPNFAKMTDRQKLSALATLHDATDYSGMTDAEKYKLMNDRFEAAFPELRAYEAEVIGRDSAHYFGSGQMAARTVKGTGPLIRAEQARQWNSQGLTDIGKLHREAYYPGMTDGQAAQAIAKRQNGGGFAGQAGVLQELKLCGLGDQKEIQGALTLIRAKLVQWARGARYLENPPILETDNAAQETEVYARAVGDRIRSGGATDWGALERKLEENQEDWDQKLADGCSQYVQSVIDGLIDEIVRGEKQDGPSAPAEEPAEGEGADSASQA